MTYTSYLFVFSVLYTSTYMDSETHSIRHVPSTSTSRPSNSLPTLDATQHAAPLQPTNVGGSSLSDLTDQHHKIKTINTSSNDSVRSPNHFLGHDKASILQVSMDGRRHPPSTFQQLEKLGEGTYATVSFAFPPHKI